MARPELVQVNFFKFLLDDLETRGVDIHRLITASELKWFNLEGSDNYVPLNCMYTLFEEVEQREGAGDFLEEFEESIYLSNLGSYGELFLSGSDLLSAGYLAIKYAPLTLTTETDGMEINGQTSKFWIRIGQASSKGFEHTVELLTGLTLRHMQLACGPDWYPDEIHLPLSYEPNLDSYLPAGHQSRIKLHQPVIAFVYPTSVLTKEIRFPAEARLENLDPELWAVGKRIRQVLDSSRPGMVPTLAFMCDWFDISERTLQRQLGSEQTSYAEVVDQWRLTKALEALEDDRLSIKEISQSLGYLKVPNFHRAFQRWTGTTPMQYRQAM